jgi:hypothetical protein
MLWQRIDLFLSTLMYVLGKGFEQKLFGNSSYQDKNLNYNNTDSFR